MTTITSARASPVPSEHPCRVWSAHAEDLALGIAAELSRWPDSPVQRILAQRGELVRVHEGFFLPLDWLGTMAGRAVAIGCVLADELRGAFVLAGPTAAWVAAGGAAPDDISLLSTARPSRLAGVQVREVPLRCGDVESIGGCPVTTPLRSATDCLRFEPSDAQAVASTRSLLAAGLVTERELDDRLDLLATMPHVRRARERRDIVLEGLR